jgi:two-component system, NtrC family, response regulator HydG
MERAVVFTEGDLVESDALPFEAAHDTADGVRIPGATMADIEKHAILSTLEAAQGSTSRAAEILDISVRTIQYRLHEYGIVVPRNRG